MALFSIGELLVIGVAFSCCIFLTALSIFGVETLEVKIVGISGLVDEVTIKSILLSDVYISSGLFRVESDVKVITSIVGDLMSSSSMLKTKDLFRCFSIWSLICCSAAALDFKRNVSFGFWLCLGFPISFDFVSFCATVCFFLLWGDSCCLGCCFLVVVLRFCCVLLFCCCCFWLFFAIESNCSWLYSSPSPVGVFVVDELDLCVNDCCFCLARLFSSGERVGLSSGAFSESSLSVETLLSGCWSFLRRLPVLNVEFGFRVLLRVPYDCWA